MTVTFKILSWYILSASFVRKFWPILPIFSCPESWGKNYVRQQ